jgi:hypothetical protein
MAFPVQGMRGSEGGSDIEFIKPFLKFLDCNGIKNVRIAFSVTILYDLR